MKMQNELTLTLKIYMSGMGPIETTARSGMMNSFNLKMHDDSDSDDREENSDVSRDDGLEIGGGRSVIYLSQDEKGDLNLTWKLRIICHMTMTGSNLYLRLGR